MKSVRRSSLAVSLPLGVGALLATVLAATALYAVSPSPESPRAMLDLAYARLRAATSFRMRETIVRPVDGLGGVGVITTEVAGARRRQVVDFDAPGLGVVRIESVRDGTRAAVRADVPALCSLAATGAPGLSATETRQLFRQVIGVALSAQLETPASVQLLALGREGAAVRTPAESRTVMESARAWLGMWHRNDGLEMMHDDDAAFTREATLLGLGQHPRYGRVWQYRQEGAAGSLRDEPVTRMIFVSAETSSLVAEEILDAAGRQLNRIEYLDIGGAITIDLPAGL